LLHVLGHFGFGGGGISLHQSLEMAHAFFAGFGPVDVLGAGGKRHAEDQRSDKPHCESLSHAARVYGVSLFCWYGGFRSLATSSCAPWVLSRVRCAWVYSFTARSR